MQAWSLDLAHAPEADRGGSPASREPIAERALSGPSGGRWSLYTGVVIIIPRSTPAYTGATPGEAAGQLSGAAVSGCIPGTGWPAGGSR